MTEQLNLGKKIVLLIFLLLGITQQVTSQKPNPYPYSIDSVHLTIWNGTEYIPFFIKGVNLGVAIPGTFPGQLAASGKDYSRWFKQIKEAGFNCIRLYTLHYPRFYEALDSFNLANPRNPLLFLQGVWLDEELPGYDNDLYFLSDAFTLEIEEDIDCVHGNRTIADRLGKAFGSFTADVSQWCLGYIIGREIHPAEVLTTNSTNSGIFNYSGKHFAIANASPSEAWVTNMLDHVADYEETNYNTQRPVSCSSWPTLDPMRHPEEFFSNEDTVSIDLSKVQIIDAPAGMFISYHAYPYYPDFISLQTSYQSYSDNYGANSYLGYLEELKSYYNAFPLIIAEFGVPSSWAIAHYASSGMNHGGFDEYNQGIANIRLLESIRNAGCGGGLQFEWIDEWFKTTWITAPVDYIPESRILWHNTAAAEQSFGLVSYGKTIAKDTLIHFDTTDVSFVNAEVNYSFFELEIGLKNPLDIPDEMWVTFDTYGENLGESILPTGDTIPHRSEFALFITNYSAYLYVTEAYDIFGIYHNYSRPTQLFHSISTDGAPWNILRIRNNSSYSSVQYIGDLQTNFYFQPPNSKDAVIISDEKISIRIPWSYLNVVAPDQMKVFNDYRNTPEKEDTISDGFDIAVKYRNKWYASNERYSWDPWVQINEETVDEKLKESYYVMKDNLYKFNTPAFAVRDQYSFYNTTFPKYIEETQGLLANDFNLDGNLMISILLENPKNGDVKLYSNGSFEYTANNGFTGYDSLKYTVYDGFDLSKPNRVIFYVDKANAINDQTYSNDQALILYPNPSDNNINIESHLEIESLQIFSITGKLIASYLINNNKTHVSVSAYQSGVYIVVAKTKDAIIYGRFIKK